MPLPHPAESKIGASYQIEFYQKMNTSAHPENFEQLAKILRRRTPGKHNRIHGCQGFSTTINRFLDVLNAINGAATTSVNPKSIGIQRYPLKSCNSLRNSTILSDRV
jgi:hypothetical protein